MCDCVIGVVESIAPLRCGRYLDMVTWKCVEVLREGYLNLLTKCSGYQVCPKPSTMCMRRPSTTCFTSIDLVFCVMVDFLIHFAADSIYTIRKIHSYPVDETVHRIALAVNKDVRDWVQLS